MISHTRSEHANHYTTDAVLFCHIVIIQRDIMIRQNHSV